MQILTQNQKIKASCNETWNVYNFGIPAYKEASGRLTCPMADKCAKACYAQAGAYNYGNTKRAYQARYDLTRSDTFETVMYNEIMSKFYASQAKGKKCIIRIHDSGDFYSKEYLKKWYNIMHKVMGTDGTYDFKTMSHNVMFYAYTKSVNLILENTFWPANFVPIFSLGGKQDYLVDQSKMRHAKVFDSEESLIEAGYVNASDNDLIAPFSDNKKIGLVYHGSKKYTKTGWTEVA